MSQSATPATQNDMTTCLETFEKDKFCSFPQRHGDATGKPATRDKTRGFRKTSISYETSSNFHSLKHAEKTCFAASPIDTATPPENQRHETRRVGALKRAFRARHPPIFTLCSFKMDVFLRVFWGTSKFATSKSMFRARLPSIFSTSHKMQRLPRNLHLVATWRSPANAICKKRPTRHVQSAAPATKNDDGHVQSAAPATKNATHLLKMSQKYCACHTKRLSTRYKRRLNVTKCHACHAKRNNETSETSKNDHLCRTYHRHGHTVLTRTVANGCGRLRPWTQRRANTPSAPRPPEWNGNPCYAFRKNPWMTWGYPLVN